MIPTTATLETKQAQAIREWMRRQYSRFLTETGRIDREAIAARAVWEFSCNDLLADDLAEQVGNEMDAPRGA